MSSPSPAAPPKKDNTVLYVVGGLVGCTFLGCAGILLIGLVFPILLGGTLAVVESNVIPPAPATATSRYTVMDISTGQPKEISPEDDCCCITTGDDGGFKTRTARECIDTKAGACVSNEMCAP